MGAGTNACDGAGVVEQVSLPLQEQAGQGVLLLSGRQAAAADQALAMGQSDTGLALARSGAVAAQSSRTALSPA